MKASNQLICTLTVLLLQPIVSNGMPATHAVRRAGLVGSLLDSLDVDTDVNAKSSEDGGILNIGANITTHNDDSEDSNNSSNNENENSNENNDMSGMSKGRRRGLIDGILGSLGIDTNINPQSDKNGGRLHIGANVNTNDDNQDNNNNDSQNKGSGSSGATTYTYPSMTMTVSPSYTVSFVPEPTTTTMTQPSSTATEIIDDTAMPIFSSYTATTTTRIMTTPMAMYGSSSMSEPSQAMTTSGSSSSDEARLLCLRTYSGCLVAHGGSSTISCENEAALCLDGL